MWSKEQLVLLVRKKSVIVGAASALSFGAGAGSTYLLTKKMLKTKYEKIAEQEIAEAKAYYTMLHKDGEYADPVKLAEKYKDEESEESQEYKEIVEKAGYSIADLENGAETVGKIIKDASVMSINISKDGLGEITKVEEVKVEEEVTETDETDEEEEPRVVSNIFEAAQVPEGEYFDYDDEVAKRSKDEPYILTHEEFMNTEKDYDQHTLTYFEGDDILVDERDEIVPDSDGLVGDDNLTRFGHGSKDNNIVYIRNENLEMEFEVVRSQGEYTKEVLGFIQHSDRPIRKFRWSDDG